MKKLLFTVITLLLLSSFAYGKDIKLYYEGREVMYDTPPVIKNDRVLVPLRAIAESMGALVTYDPKEKDIYISYGTKNIKMTVGSDVYAVDHILLGMDTAPEIINGRTMVPVRYMASSFDTDIKWDADNSVVYVSRRQIESSTLTTKNTDKASKNNYTFERTTIREPVTETTTIVIGRNKVREKDNRPYKTYKEYDEVPDYGAVNEISLYEKEKRDNSRFYFYDMREVEENIRDEYEDKYISVLSDYGFTFDNITVRSDYPGQELHVCRKGKTCVVFGLNAKKTMYYVEILELK